MACPQCCKRPRVVFAGQCFSAANLSSLIENLHLPAPTAAAASAASAAITACLPGDSPVPAEVPRGAGDELNVGHRHVHGAGWARDHRARARGAGSEVN